MKYEIDHCKNTGDNTIENQPDSLYFCDETELPKSMIEWIERNKNDLITVWDENGIIRFMSKSVERLLGYKTCELQGTRWYEKISPEDVSYIEKHIHNTTYTGKIFNINIRNKFGKYIWSECNVAKILDDETNENYYISTLRDISDKKEMEEMMIRSEKMSIAGQLAAGVAHEIRNPLTSLKGFIQLLQAGVNRKEEYYNIMIDEIEKMETITSELLFISKPMTDNKKNESIADMIRDVVELLKPQAKLKNSIIEWEQTKDASIYCDRSQMKQVFINLIKNAIEAMDDGGIININVYATDSNVMIDIIDQGTGVPEEIVHKLGEPFFTTKQNGTGLGLMITHQILEHHKAKLEISRNKVKGSTFRIVIQR
ncbi:ATP-binding protein [Lentibacillus sp. Marseille-P4043]|uniref:ATP-binding protein n=1 Tax=Lentibacillus sp. Marseille-P4043 TaxID=2040293 RepID=UPI001F2003CF|nr:ATP-binding protein [Lentibacillus sp. Marseille-P4043]